MTGTKCLSCLWFLTGRRCMAYMTEIPDAYSMNEEEHNEVQEDQDGDYVFEHKDMKDYDRRLRKKYGLK